VTGLGPAAELRLVLAGMAWAVAGALIRHLVHPFATRPTRRRHQETAMSYLSQLKNRQLDAKGFLAKSVRYLKDKLGITVSDTSVDRAVTATDHLTDAVEVAVRAYLATALPQLPAALATSAATAVLNHIDAAIAGAGNVVKDNN
jgi:hypothetical protein